MTSARSVAGLAHVHCQAPIQTLDESLKGGAADLAPVEKFDYRDVAQPGFAKAHVASPDTNFLCEMAPAQACMKPKLSELISKGGISRRKSLVHVPLRCLSRVPSRRFWNEEISSPTAASNLSTSAVLPLLQNDSVSRVKGCTSIV